MEATLLHKQSGNLIANFEKLAKKLSDFLAGVTGP